MDGNSSAPKVVETDGAMAAAEAIFKFSFCVSNFHKSTISQILHTTKPPGQPTSEGAVSVFPAA
jgi:hypothetical protein